MRRLLLKSATRRKDRKAPLSDVLCEGHQLCQMHQSILITHSRTYELNSLRSKPRAQSFIQVALWNFSLRFVYELLDLFLVIVLIDWGFK